MNDRERFHATMHYKPVDRSPICDFGFWLETIDEWYAQGLPTWVKHCNYNPVYTNQYFGMDSLGGGPSPNVGLCPAFEEKVLEDRGDFELRQQGDGVIVLRKKRMGSIPQHHGHLPIDRDSWNKHYKPRLDPDHPDRYPKDWSQWQKQWDESTRTTPRVAACGSLYGWIRDWMGVENLSMVIYDDPAWFEEMVETLANLTIAGLERAFAHGAKFEGASFWEDMCYNAGPLLSPEHYKQYVIPHYKRITALLRKHGCDVAWVDCDGKIDSLIPLWLDAGINCMFPIEVGTWGADPIRYRKEYGRDLLLMGGFDKHILSRSKEAIEAEVYRLSPLVEEGGYIGFADHRVPPDVPLDNYLHYLRCVRRVWGQGVNLKPVTWE